MMKIRGLDKLQKNLKQLERAMAELDGDLTTVSFDPADPQSIEIAIQNMEAEIDKRIGTDANNNLVAGLADQLKEHFRTAILEKAAAARTSGTGNDH